MRESVWGYAMIILGIIAICFIWFFTTVTNIDQHNYQLLKETVESAMYDALDLTEYRQSGIVKIDEKKFVENFTRRFAENASLAYEYEVYIYDVNEVPPKVSLKVTTHKKSSAYNINLDLDMQNHIDAILETKY